jgi:Domain of unknown function (DUF4157)
MPASRPLISTERELLHCFGDRIDLDRVRIYNSRSLLGRIVIRFTRGAAFALGYHVFIPRKITLPIMAHELTHVCQYQEWGVIRYLARGAWNQIVLRTILRRDVYQWEPVPGKAFQDYGMEQQGQIVQDCFDVASPRRRAAQKVSPYTPR